MTTLTLPLFAAPLLAMAAFALDRRLRAVRTRRQVIDALAAVPELVGLVPAGHADRAATLSQVLGARLDRAERDRVATVARLAELDPDIVAAADVGDDIVRLLHEVRTAPPGRAGPAATVVRVATAVERQAARTAV